MSKFSRMISSNEKKNCLQFSEKFRPGRIFRKFHYFFEFEYSNSKRIFEKHRKRNLFRISLSTKLPSLFSVFGVEYFHETDFPWDHTRLLIAKQA
jgi:hypothetical protein